MGGPFILYTMDYNPYLQRDITDIENKLRRLQVRFNNLGMMDDREKACSCETECRMKEGRWGGAHYNWCQLNSGGNDDKQSMLENMYSQGQSCHVPALDSAGRIDRTRPGTMQKVEKYTGNWARGKKRFYRACAGQTKEDFALTPNLQWGDMVVPDESWAADAVVAGVGLGALAAVGTIGAAMKTGYLTRPTWLGGGSAIEEPVPPTEPPPTEGDATSSSWWKPWSWGQTAAVETPVDPPRLTDKQLELLDRDNPLKLKEQDIRNAEQAAAPLTWTASAWNPYNMVKPAVKTMNEAEMHDTQRAENEQRNKDNPLTWAASAWNPSNMVKPALGPMTEEEFKRTYPTSQPVIPMHNITRTDTRNTFVPPVEQPVSRAVPLAYAIGTPAWQAQQDANRAAFELAEKKRKAAAQATAQAELDRQVVAEQAGLVHNSPQRQGMNATPSRWSEFKDGIPIISNEGTLRVGEKGLKMQNGEWVLITNHGVAGYSHYPYGF